MSDDPGRSAPDLEDCSTAGSGPHRVGEYLLVAPLGDDAFGSVYRALHTGNGRFVRLRVLQSPELSPRAMLTAALRRIACRSANGMAQGSSHARIHVSDAIPYLVWPDSNGWTLDFVLIRSRARGCGMPIEFALMIAERVAAEIEKTRLSAIQDEPSFHGSLWPGFVDISSDAEVQVEGFGLSDAVLPALTQPRMWRDIAPYIAPEARSGEPIGEGSDVYAIGVLLAELLTGQRASADRPAPRWRADDDFSQEISLLLRFALGHSLERFSTIQELRLALRELISGCPFETSPADLALFLYDLLNPESRTLSAPFDGNSTNPLPLDPSQISASAIRRPTALPSACSIEGEQSLHVVERSIPDVRRSFRPFLVQAFARMRILAQPAGRAAAVAVATLALALVNVPFAQNQIPFGAERIAVSSSENKPPRPPRPPANPPLSSAGVAAASAAPFSLWAAAASSPAESRLHSEHGILRAGRRAPDARPAETLRLKAALARIDAERLDAPMHAADVFDQGRDAEREAETSFRDGDYSAAHDNYARALDLFSEAQSLSREARVREIQLATDAR